VEPDEAPSSRQVGRGAADRQLPKRTRRRVDRDISHIRHPGVAHL